MPADKKKYQKKDTHKYTCRNTAVDQCNDDAWVRRALDAGITQDLIDMRLRVCQMPTRHINFVIGLFAGDGTDPKCDPIAKCARTLYPKTKRKRKRKRKRSVEVEVEVEGEDEKPDWSLAGVSIDLLTSYVPPPTPPPPPPVVPPCILPPKTKTTSEYIL